jgi:hypothetical protein
MITDGFVLIRKRRCGDSRFDGLRELREGGFEERTSSLDA